jgi:hypothetical protein
MAQLKLLYPNGTARLPGGSLLVEEHRAQCMLCPNSPDEWRPIKQH